MVTLSDVAKEANVSKMTVSRAINHPEQVTPELLELVEKAMDKLHYRPNSAARALVNNRTNVVKFITLEDIDTTEPYYMNLLFGVARGLTKEQYALQLVTDIGDIGKAVMMAILLPEQDKPTMTCLMLLISPLFYMAKIGMVMIMSTPIIAWAKKLLLNMRWSEGMNMSSLLAWMSKNHLNILVKMAI